jgi:hypothetical protein
MFLVEVLMKTGSLMHQIWMLEQQDKKTRVSELILALIRLTSDRRGRIHLGIGGALASVPISVSCGGCSGPAPIITHHAPFA